MEMEPAARTHELLTRHARGDRRALDEMFPILYDELRKLARAYMRRERPGGTLQPTALVHEAYAKLLGQREVDFRNRAQFMGVAALAMRRLLLDRARQRGAQARGGGAVHVPIDEALDAAPEQEVDVLALDVALEKLAALSPRQAKVVELRFFGGLGIEEAAEVVGCAVPTANRDWRMARAFLYAELRGGSGGATRRDA